MLRSLPITLLITTAIMAVAAPAANASWHAKFDGHQGEVLIESWSLPAPKSTVGTSGMSAGKVSYSDLSVMISLEKATPLLHLAVANGKHIPSLELSFRAPGDARAVAPERMQGYLTVTLEEVMVSSYNTSADNKNIRLSLNFTKITYSYTPMSDSYRTGKTMAAEVLASGLGHAGGANFVFADGSVRFLS